MYQYAELMKGDRIWTMTEHYYCPTCGKNLWTTLAEDEQRFYYVCNRCKVTRMFETKRDGQ